MAIDIPPALANAVKEQRAVLFLGAGASRGAMHPRGEKIPTGLELRDLLCDRFLGNKLKDRSLSEVAEFAINETSLDEVQLFVTDLLKEFQAAEFHKLIPTFRWHSIVTTNIDLIIESAYEQCSDRLQQLVPFFKNGQLVETEVKKVPFPLQYVKLHGCIEYPYDHDAPFILAMEQYAKWSRGRSRLFERVRDWGREFSFIFCGYSVSDPHIQTILFDLFDEQLHRPNYFCISPHFEDVEMRYWTRQRITPIKADFAAFLGALDVLIPKTQRILPSSYGGGESSLRKYYRISHPTESDLLLSFLSDDVDHIRPDMPIRSQVPAEFYRGYDTGWGCIAQGLDARRAVVDTALVDTVLTEEEQRSASTDFYVLKGPAGNGKTVCLKRIAWETAHEFGKIVLFLKPSGTLRIDAAREICALTGSRLFLFVDRAALLHDELRSFLRGCRSEKLPITIIAAERDNEWNIRCGDLDPFVSAEFPVRFLNEAEIRRLLELLEQHHALGLLAQMPYQERLDAFVKRAERQLLVALHETTLGRPFEEIVLDEYKGISPEEARLLYLDVCALNRLGVAVRAGLISRVGGIRFEDFKSRFFSPLEHVLMTRKDKYTGDMMYVARHQHVAELVFQQVLADPEELSTPSESTSAHRSKNPSAGRRRQWSLASGRGEREGDNPLAVSLKI
jgi:SIR2-like domain